MSTQPARNRRSLLELLFLFGSSFGAEAARQPVLIGNGSGQLRYPDAQATLKLQPGDTLYISPGNYSGVSLGNLSGSDNNPITVLCDSNAVFTTREPQANEFRNLAYLRFENFRLVSGFHHPERSGNSRHRAGFRRKQIHKNLVLQCRELLPRVSERRDLCDLSWSVGIFEPNPILQKISCFLRFRVSNFIMRIHVCTQTIKLVTEIGRK